MKLPIYGCVLLLLMTSCSTIGNQQESKADEKGGNDMTLQDIAFNKNSESLESYTVYIQENDSFVPFLVISSDYDGNVLLLRKFLLDEMISYSNEKSQGMNGGYYPTSNVDAYLNSTYLSYLSSELVAEIVDANISVSTLEGVGSGGSNRKTENIKRKVFLLSATELNIKSGMASVEGAQLSYFKTSENAIATYKNGDPDAYWLRSAYHWDDIQAWVIGSNGSHGGSSVSLNCAVRPAFCLPNDTLIHKEEVDGMSVYVVSS